jgi:hypothetical protein
VFAVFVVLGHVPFHVAGTVDLMADEAHPVLVLVLADLALQLSDSFGEGGEEAVDVGGEL